MKYRVFDATGTLLRAFRTWKEANQFRIENRRYDWTIKEY